jgi:hypothetical protein
MICLDCADPAGLAAFWAALLGGEVAPILGDDAVMVKNKGIPVAALRVPGYQPPTWPSGAIPKQVHLDLAVDDLDAAEAEAIRLGARLAGEQPHPTRWRVMLDPAGHPFCLCDWSKELPANRKDPDHGPTCTQRADTRRCHSAALVIAVGAELATACVRGRCDRVGAYGGRGGTG